MQPKKRTSLDKTQLRKLYKDRVYHILLACVFIVVLFQLLYGTGMNITRFITLNKQIKELRDLNRLADKKNIQLKEQLRIYSSYSGIEELARNNLKMVGKDEVLILVKNKPEPVSN
jgi:cell division protein FtsB